jgi:hypothetical protein
MNHLFNDIAEEPEVAEGAHGEPAAAGNPGAIDVVEIVDASAQNVVRAKEYVSFEPTYWCDYVRDMFTISLIRNR